MLGEAVRGLSPFSGVWLYANPLAPGENQKLADWLSTTPGLRFPSSQVLHLSDAARDRRQPLKKVIEDTLSGFLDSSREQDRLLIVFTGHAVENDEKGLPGSP